MKAEDKIHTPYIKFFIKDFLTSPDVADMEADEVGAYFLLLCTSFLEKKKGYLKNDDDYLRKKSRLKKSQWEKSKDVILSKFTEDETGDLYNERWLHEINDAENAIKINRERTKVARKALKEKRLSQQPPNPKEITYKEDSETHEIKTSNWLSIDEYIEYRESEFTKIEEEILISLKKNIGIDKPYCWCNRRGPQGYFDLVDCLIKVREDVEWRSSIQRNNNITKEKFLQLLYAFVKEIKDSKRYMGYDGYDSSDGKENFIAHFSSWLKLKLIKK